MTNAAHFGHCFNAMADIINKTDIEIGVVATHSGWVGGIVPDDDGNAPRTSEGELVVLSEMKKLQKLSAAPLTDCPACEQSELSRLVSAAGFRLATTKNHPHQAAAPETESPGRCVLQETDPMTAIAADDPSCLSTRSH